MNKIWFVLVLLMAITLPACNTKQNKLSITGQEITFTTAEEAPGEFTNWTFFWSMPEIEGGAKLEYKVLGPDGEVFFKYDILQPSKAGTSIRSDFTPGIIKRDQSVLFCRKISIRFRVSKGEMKFNLSGVKFVFKPLEMRIDAVASVDP